MTAVFERLIRRLPGHKIDIGQHPKAPAVDERVAALLLKAFEAESDRDPDLSRRLYADAASGARIIYELTPTGTPEEISRRTMHGELAFSALSSAGETDEAMTFGYTLLADPLIPGAVKAKIQRTVTIPTS